MRQKLIFVLATLILVTVVFLSAVSPFVLWLTAKRLQAIFVNSQLRIADCVIKPDSQVVFSQIEIKRLPFYSLRIGRIILQYRILSLIRGRLDKLKIEKLNGNFDINKKDIRQFLNEFHLDSVGGIIVETIELEDFDLAGRVGDFYFQGVNFSCLWDLFNEEPKKLRLKFDNLKNNQVEFKVFNLYSEETNQVGFSLFEARLKKLKIGDIKGKLSWQGRNIFAEISSGQMLDGRLQAGLGLATKDKSFSYQGKIRFDGISLEGLSRQLEFQNHIFLSGDLTGEVSFAGDSNRLKVLSGKMVLGEKGGVVNIVDLAPVKGLAAKDALDIFVESLKNYHYNRGSIDLSLDEGNLNLLISLSGETGRREFSIVLHDFERFYLLGNLLSLKDGQ